MILPTQTELMVALCCGDTCKQDTGLCHRRDFVGECLRVRALLERKQKETDHAADPVEAG
jgi:hypothetical protein